jgi:SAM-dependent methyltransferase
MDARSWDERYAATDQAWSSEPNAIVVTLTEGLVPGTAIDLGTGEGRNARWLAEHGWQVTAVDFSAVAIDRARSAAGDEQIDWQVADLTTNKPLLQEIATDITIERREEVERATEHGTAIDVVLRARRDS